MKISSNLKFIAILLFFMSTAKSTFAYTYSIKADSVERSVLYRFIPKIDIIAGGGTVFFKQVIMGDLEPRLLPIPTYRIGVSATIPIFDKDFSVRLGANISMKGYRYNTTTIWDGAVTIKAASFKYYYLEVPLDLKLAVFKNIFIEGGIAINYMINSISDVSFVGFNRLTTGSFYTLNLGLSYSITKKWGLGVNYNKGITNFREDKDLWGYVDRSTKISSLFVTVSYRIL